MVVVSVRTDFMQAKRGPLELRSSRLGELEKTLTEMPQFLVEASK
jgi:hypothetical protein